MLSRTAFRTSTAFKALASRSYSTGGSSCLVVADHNNEKLNPATLSAVTAAREIAGDAKVDLLVAGANVDAVAAEAAGIEGVGRVLVKDDAVFGRFLGEPLSLLVADVQKKFNHSHVLTSASSVGKTFLPRAAAMLDVAPISEIIAVKSDDTFVRPIYAGNALATVQSSDPVKLITVRPTAFEKSAV